MIITKEDKAMLQEAVDELAREGRVEGNQFIAPEGFFERWNAKLRTGKPLFMEDLMRKLLER